ncbi:MAG: exonuclease SbcCD subunit D [Clostridia bacterium]|nr:exonuclease SbcCD subunit D [Clostridia bacterium]
MKLLHIADLHLGKRVFAYSMLEEQRAVLAQIKALALAEGIDALLIAGDVYDRTVPPAEATVLLSDFLTALSAAQIPVYLIAGNHDSAERLAFAAPLLADSGVFVAADPAVGLQTRYLDTEEGRVAIHMLPHFRPAELAHAMGKEGFADSAAALSALLAEAPRGVADYHVLLAHLFVAGSESSDSEAPVIGTVDAVPAGLLADFDYVALGHLHRPQSPDRNIVYAGSPLCYSFSEAGQGKSAVLVTLDEKGTDVRRLPLTPIHAMREVRGTMQELTAMPYSEDYIRAVVTDEDVVPDACLTLRANFPNLMRFAVESGGTSTEEIVAPTEAIASRAPLDLFAEHFLFQNGEEPSEAHMALMRRVLSDAEVLE